MSPGPFALVLAIPCDEDEKRFGVPRPWPARFVVTTGTTLPAAQLPRGDYQVMLLDTLPALVTPGSTGDYFAFDGPAGWRDEEFEYSIDPANTNYYRLDRRRVGDHDELFEFAVPMVEPTDLELGTVVAAPVTTTVPSRG